MTAARLVPTARALPWAPLVAVAGCLAATTALAAATGAWPAVAPGLLAAALAAAVVAGQRDPAAALLAAVPVSAARRRADRLALTLPAGLALWALALAAAGRWGGVGGRPVAPLLALTAAGLAVLVWAPRRYAVEAGAAVPLLWFAADRVTGPGHGPAGLLGAWTQHPWAVTATAVVALLIGRNR